MTVAGLLLAAGEGRRMGQPKALVEVGEQTLVQRGITLLREGGCDPVVVVLGAHAEAVQPLVAADVVVADDWAVGIGASLRAGLRALLASEATACVVALVDQPDIGAEAVRRLLAVDGATDAAVATYDASPRNPVRLSRRVWGEVAELAVGDVGARAWLHEHPGRVLHVPCDDTGSPHDLDTPEELAAARQRFS